MLNNHTVAHCKSLILGDICIFTSWLHGTECTWPVKWIALITSMLRTSSLWLKSFISCSADLQINGCVRGEIVTYMPVCIKRQWWDFMNHCVLMLLLISAGYLGYYCIQTVCALVCLFCCVRVRSQHAGESILSTIKLLVFFTGSLSLKRNRNNFNRMEVISSKKALVTARWVFGDPITTGYIYITSDIFCMDLPVLTVRIHNDKCFVIHRNFTEKGLRVHIDKYLSHVSPTTETYVWWPMPLQLQVKGSNTQHVCICEEIPALESDFMTCGHKSDIWLTTISWTSF